MTPIWVAAADGDVPENAVEGGEDNGQPLYVARAWFRGHLVPGKLHSAHKCCYIPYGRRERKMFQYEVLVADPDTVEWVASRDGDYVRDAIVGGHESSGESYYIGRCGLDGKIIPGKVQLDRKVCYVSYGGKEANYCSYEILVSKQYC